MNDYFERLESQLAALTKEGAHLSEDARRPAAARLGAAVPAVARRALGATVPAVAIAVSIAVAAVILLSVNSRAPKPSRPFRHGAPAPVGARIGALTLQQLLDNFAVLRRPQTTRDRTWYPQCSCAGSALQENGLTRLAQTLPNGYRVFFDVEQFTVGGQEGMPAGSYVLNLDIVGPNGNSTSSFFGANVQYMVNPLRYGGLRAAAGQGTARASVLAGIVPDGVGSVSWTIGCQTPRNARRCTGPHLRAYTVPVINNVAALELPYDCGICQAQRITWRAPQTGQLVASFTGGNIPAPPFVKGGRGMRTLRALLSQGLGPARFGQPATTAIRTIEQLLGPAAAANVPVGGCGIDRESVWSSPAVATPLTIFERHGRFVGYEYGSATDRLDLGRGPGAVLATARGLTLADTIGTAKTLYGPELATGSSHGGSWHLAGSALGGYVTPTIYPLRRVTAANPVATIEAGDTGCAPRSTR